jgi:UDP:flavonoid glycosyltransferase YjiC (YdhE family)
MLIVGTRGDVQPFIAIGKRLQVSCDVFFLFSAFHSELYP